jgi:DNA polymerase-3 subunit delta'
VSDDPFAGLVGQEAARAQLTAALAAPAHAYLLTGPAGSGVQPFTRRFAAALVGVEERMFDTGHPDLREVRPEGTQIRMEQVRELWHDVQMRPFSADRRVYVLWNAEAMPELVQHALLKSIEDPPSYAVMLLATALPHLLLDTVRSRCQTVTFHRLTRDEAAEVLRRDRGLDAETAAALARQADGDAARALELADGGDAAERRALYLDLARAAIRDPDFDPGDAATRIDKAAARRGELEAKRIEREAGARLEAMGDLPAAERRRLERPAEELAKRRRRAAHVEEVQAAVDTATSWYRDVVASSVGAGDTVVNSDRRAAIEADAAAGAGPAAEQALDVARAARRSLRTLTLTPALALEGLFHQIWLGAARRRR